MLTTIPAMDSLPGKTQKRSQSERPICPASMIHRCIIAWGSFLGQLSPSMSLVKLMAHFSPSIHLFRDFQLHGTFLIFLGPKVKAWHTRLMAALHGKNMKTTPSSAVRLRVGTSLAGATHSTSRSHSWIHSLTTQSPTTTLFLVLVSKALVLACHCTGPGLQTSPIGPS